MLRKVGPQNRARILSQYVFVFLPLIVSEFPGGPVRRRVRGRRSRRDVSDALSALNGQSRDNMRVSAAAGPVAAALFRIRCAGCSSRDVRPLSTFRQRFHSHP